MIEGSAREDKIRLICIGRSTKPIKDLIQYCRSSDNEKQKASTVIRYPLSKKMRAADRPPWAPRTFRRSRPLDTISLNKSCRTLVLPHAGEKKRCNVGPRLTPDPPTCHQQNHIFSISTTSCLLHVVLFILCVNNDVCDEFNGEIGRGFFGWPKRERLGNLCPHSSYLAEHNS